MRPCGRIATSGVGGRNIFWRRPKGDFLTDGASESRKWRNPSLGGSTRLCREVGADGNSVESGAVGAVHSPSVDGRPCGRPLDSAGRAPKGVRKNARLMTAMERGYKGVRFGRCGGGGRSLRDDEPLGGQSCRARLAGRGFDLSLLQTEACPLNP
jgi:hypothetical protein